MHAVNLFVHIDVSQHHQRMTCVKDHLNPSAGPLKVPLKAGSQNRAFSNFLSVPFLAKPVQIAPGLCQLFKNLSRLGISLCLPKSSSHHSSNPGPPRTHHHYIFTTWPPTYIVCLWFGLTSSREDLSRLWNQLFRLQGPIPVQMAPGLTTLFWKFSSGIETSLQGDFWGSSQFRRSLVHIIA